MICKGPKIFPGEGTTGYVTFPWSNDTSAWVNIYADNEPDGYPDGNYETVVSEGEVNLAFAGDKSNPNIICGPHILTGWQAARELEGIVANPGDGKYYQGILWPFTWEEYIEKLRTDWADNIFVLAGGSDPGGNLREVSPLELDIYDPPMTCPPMIALTTTFLLRYDIAPLGQPPDSQGIGAEYIQWPDPAYPNGYPNDDEAFNEKEYALWDITYLIGDICNHQQFKMRVRVTDHLDNWVRSGVMDMSWIGIQGVDENRVNVESLYAYDYPTYHHSWKFSGFAPEDVMLGEASIIHLRNDEGKAYLYYAAKVQALRDPPEFIIGYAKSTEATAPGPLCVTQCYLTFWFLDPTGPGNLSKINSLIQLLGPLPECGYFYLATLTVQDTANAGIPGTIYISSRDTESWGGDCNDHTFIAANCEKSNWWNNTGPFFDFEANNQNLTYGKRRGSGRMAPNPSEEWDKLAWYNYERMIKTGGFEMVTTKIDDEELRLPVQSQADLIFINSHGGPDDIRAYGSVSRFSDQRQVEPADDYVCFSSDLFFPHPHLYENDFLPEQYCKFPFFKLQDYQPPYNEPSWLVLDSCHQLSIHGSPNSARDYWHKKLYYNENDPNTGKYFDCIAGYSEGVIARHPLFNYRWSSYFLKYCAADFSEMLESGAPYDPDYYYIDDYYAQLMGPQNKVNWLIDAWLASHLKTHHKLIAPARFNRVVLLACAMNDQYFWFIREAHKPGTLHIPFLQAKEFYIFRSGWNGP